ncbi:hypothetical protein B9Z55_026590 [Caenorhabditis nigoni]|nr:hypothetical protein B9Z55_026590 [Caenorhabditis nigoni]
MQQNDQQSPGYDYEPLGVDHRLLPVSFQLTNGEEYFFRGWFGQGGFSVVFRVRDQNGQQYAAKVLTQRATRHSIRRELEAYQRIAQNPHINLLTLHVAGKLMTPSPGYKDDVFITEAAGPSIRDIMMRAKRDIGNVQSPTFSIDDIKGIGRQVGEALFHLEKLQIYHLDIKAANVTFMSNVQYAVDTNLTPPIIRMSDLKIKIIDYGNSMSHWTPGIERSFKLVQPQNLRAPEIFMGIPHSEKTDVWSMGCLMGKMYLGKSIFMSRILATPVEMQQSQFELIVNRMHAAIPREMIEISRQESKCTLNFEFLNAREGENNQDSLINLMRQGSDLPLFEFLTFVLIFNPAERPSFEEVLRHKFLTNV